MVALHVITNFLIVSSPHKSHKGIWHAGLNNGVGTPHISGNSPFHTAALSPLSARYTTPSTEPNNNLLQSQTTRNCNLLQYTSPTNQPTGSRLPDNSYKLWRLTNRRAGSPVVALHKSQPHQALDIICCSPKGVRPFTFLIERSKHSQLAKGVLTFGHTTMLPGTKRSNDAVVHRPITAQL
jgi:hypothetical protein